MRRLVPTICAAGFVLVGALLVVGSSSPAVAAAARGTVSSPAGTLFDYDRSAPLGAVLGKTISYQGVVRQELAYDATASLRLKAYFVHPATGGPWPIVIWSPGYGGDRRQQLPEAVAIAKQGVASLLVDAPPAKTACNKGKDLQVYVSYVVSRRRAVDLAQTLPNVKAKRIAAAGFSYGAEITGTLAGVEHRIRAFALKSGRGEYTGFARIFCKSLGEQGLDEFEATLGVVNPVRWVPRTAHAAMLMQNGTKDTLTPRDDVLALYAAARNPKVLRWYPAGHDLNAAATAYRAQWLLRHLR